MYAGEVKMEESILPYKKVLRKLNSSSENADWWNHINKHSLWIRNNFEEKNLRFSRNFNGKFLAVSLLNQAWRKNPDEIWGGGEFEAFSTCFKTVCSKALHLKTGPFPIETNGFTPGI